MKKLFSVVALLAVVAAFAVGCKKEEGVTTPDASKPPTEAPAVPATNAPAH
jgi:hypothetical protein